MDTHGSATSWRSSGSAGQRPLEDLVNAGGLAGTPGARHGAYRLQGRLAEALARAAGADVHGLALEPPTTPSLHALVGAENAEPIDVRDGERVAARVREVEPEVAFHLAAQALVRRRTPTRSGRTP